MMLWIIGVWGVYFLPSGRAWRMLRRSPVPCTGWSRLDVLMAKTVFVPVIGVAVSLFLPREETFPAGTGRPRSGTDPAMACPLPPGRQHGSKAR